MATKKDTPAQAAETATDIATATETATESVAETTTEVETATEQAVDPAPAAKASTGSYIVASPIKHDGEDYAPGDTIRLPEAVAHRLAGFLRG